MTAAAALFSGFACGFMFSASCYSFLGEKKQARTLAYASIMFFMAWEFWK